MGPSLALGMLAALLCGACGFAGEDPFAGRRVADVAPWQDVGAITVCEGAVRLSPLDDAGLCALGDGAACRADGDCRSRERCVCGRCTVALCDSTDECSAAEVCTFAERRCDRSCGKDADCARGELCVPGKSVCRGRCSSAADCQTGESCQTSTGQCVTAPCADDTSCVGGRTCALQRRAAALAEPAPLVDGARLVLYLERRDAGSAPTVWRAVGTDGVSFTLDPPHALFDGAAPAVARANSTIVLLFADGAGQLLATRADDGVSFAPGAAVLAGDSPSLVALADETLAAYYVTAAGVARATSTDGATFVAGATVLTAAAVSDPVLWQGVDLLASPFAELRRDAAGAPLVRLWFAGRGTESAPAVEFGEAQPIPANFSVGEAASRDGLAFTPYPFNPVFDRVLSFLDHRSELEPAVVSFGGVDRLYYRRATADGTGSDGLAVAVNPPTPR